MKLIVNADDFGMSIGANYGILHAFTHGILTSTTMMVTMPGVDHAVQIAKKNPKLKIGLHLNITFKKPLTNAKSLVKGNGDFYKPKENPNQELFEEEEIYQEFLAQYNKFIELMGIKPTHIDTHLYAHQKYKKAFNAALRLSNEKEVAIRGYSNNHYNESIFIDKFKYKNNDLEKTLTDVLNSLEKNKTYELMVHPALLDDFIIKNSSYKEGRTYELEALTSDKIKEIIKMKKIQLIDFSQTRRNYV